MFVCCNLPQNSILASASPLHSSPFHLPSLQFQHLNVSKYLAKMLLPGQKTRGQHNETLLHFRQSHAYAHTHTKSSAFAKHCDETKYKKLQQVGGSVGVDGCRRWAGTVGGAWPRLTEWLAACYGALHL